MNTIPQILDPFARVVRTGIQVLIAMTSLFLVLAALWPSVVTAIQADDASTVGVGLAASAAWVTTVAGIIARVMAVPGVNLLLQRIGLAGHSGESVSSDTWTTFVPTQAPLASTADPLH